MIEFVESTHTYLLDGVILPSVSTILKATVFKDKYKEVPPLVLERAAQFGKNVHKAIETNFDIFLTEQESVVFNRYKRLIKKHDITPMEHEQIVYTKDYAGTLDMIGKVGNDLCLLDIKTTYHLDREYLSWQLSMYEYAYGKQFDKLYAIWLPKRKGAELVEIERKSEEDIKKLVEVYYANSR